jgi:thiol-disulfide isomerase/thioredoxin
MKINHLVVGWFLLAIAGCVPTPNRNLTLPSNSNTTAASDSASATGDTIDTEAVVESSSNNAIRTIIANWDETQKLVSKHQGKIVVLDIWSTWCAPCKREFPHLVALQEKYPDQVVCMSLNVDYAGFEGDSPESHREDVEKFLTEVNARFQNIICSESDEAVFTRLKLDSIPAVYVYDKEGKVHTRFDNTTRVGEEFTYAGDINPLIEKLLAE